MRVSRWFERLRERLIQCDEMERADLIFVLAGHRNRKIYGARLFRDGWAQRVLMSTTNPGYIARVLEQELASAEDPGNEVWKRVHETSILPQPARGHFFVSLDSAQWLVEPISVHWFGTLSEMKALGGWLSREAPTRSLLIISSAIHSKRIRICCEAFIPGRCRVKIIAVPVDQGQSRATLPFEPISMRRIVSEWAKVLLYRAVLPFYEAPRSTNDRLD